MYFIYIQALSKHGADSIDFYLRSDLADCQVAVDQAESYVYSQLPYGYQIVDDALRLQLAPFDDVAATGFRPI
jgi:hypothetical protein